MVANGTAGIRTLRLRSSAEAMRGSMPPPWRSTSSGIGERHGGAYSAQSKRRFHAIVNAWGVSAAAAADVGPSVHDEIDNVLGSAAIATSWPRRGRSRC